MITDDHRGFSLVMNAFQGKYMLFQEAAEREFGRQGISAFSLCCGKDYLPAEIGSGLAFDVANRIAGVLEATGASMSVVPSLEVTGVRSYSGDCWPDRQAGRWKFTEVDGMVLTLSPLNARRNIRALQEHRPEARPWQAELAFNHQHPTHDYSRHALRVAREMGADLAAALQEAYPDRGFVVEYLEEQMSFHQRSADALEDDEPPTDPLAETTYCPACKGHQAYLLRLEPDIEFPKADWGECANCDSEVLLRTWTIRTIL